MTPPLTLAPQRARTNLYLIPFCKEGNLEEERRVGGPLLPGMIRNAMGAITDRQTDRQTDRHRPV